MCQEFVSLDLSPLYKLNFIYLLLCSRKLEFEVIDASSGLAQPRLLAHFKISALSLDVLKIL